MFGTSHKKRQEEKIAALRQSLKLAQEGRDKHKAKLAELGRAHSYLRAHKQALQELFNQHIKPQFCATPTTAELSSHISHKDGLKLAVPDDAWLLTGYVCAVQLKDLLRAVLGQGYRPQRVLDFGCGSARTTRYLPILPGVETLYGCDIDASALDWLKNLPDLQGTFFQVSDRPPLPPELPPLDLILAQSVFTHLPLDLETEWLTALSAALAPGGVMVLTFHGASFDRFVPTDRRATLQSEGFLHCNTGLTPGLPDYYQTSFHTEDYIRKTWSRYGHVLAIHEFGFEGQDVAVLQNST